VGGCPPGLIKLPVGSRGIHHGPAAKRKPTSTLPADRPRYQTARRPRTGSPVANLKSQTKRIGTNRKATERNKAVKSEVKTAIRATREAIAAGDKKAATASLVAATRKLDKAASKGVIHKNQAANRKSSIAKQVAAL